MLIPIIISAYVASALFGCLIFELAALALPVMVGITTAGWAHQSGAGAISVVLIGIAARLILFGAGHFLFLITRPRWSRAVIIAAFLVPAMACGYLIAFGIVHPLLPSEIWQWAFASMGPVAVGPAPSGGSPLGQRLIKRTAPTSLIHLGRSGADTCPGRPHHRGASR